MINWISVKDRLPKDGERVITWTDLYRDLSPLYEKLSIGIHTYFSEYAHDPEAWWIGGTNHLVEDGVITHWAEWNSPHGEK